jgi:hypothetical protein
MRSSRAVIASECQCQSHNSHNRWRQMKQCWINYKKLTWRFSAYLSPSWSPHCSQGTRSLTGAISNARFLCWLREGQILRIKCNSFRYVITQIQAKKRERRSSVDSASVCYKAGPSSILSSAPQGVISYWGGEAIKIQDWPRKMVNDERMYDCIVWTNIKK